MVNLFYGSFDSANPNHRIIFSLANEKTMRQKELDYALDRKELPTFLPDRKDFDFNEPGAGPSIGTILSKIWVCL